MAPKMSINWAMNSMDLNTIDDLARGQFPISFPFLSDMYMCVCVWVCALLSKIQVNQLKDNNSL